ncbi:hypothetical protein KKC17_03545 [Patescibacteria group bacterium]|nr:hypothetical protein [Patescibacteria group bacterium]
MNKILKSISCLSCLGTLFALTVTLRQYIAPANEPGIFSCVGLKIFGLSPCPFGLGFFALLLLSSLLALRQKSNWFSSPKTIRFFAWAGTLFSGWVAWREIGLPILIRGLSNYWQTFSLAQVPACVWGFFVFLAVAILSLYYKNEKK